MAPRATGGPPALEAGEPLERRAAPHRAGAEVTIDTTKPVVFKWKPTDQQVGIKIYQFELFALPKSGVQVEGTFDGTAGGATIPPELFEDFVSDPTHSRMSGVWAFHTAFKDLTASGYPVQAWGGSWIDTPVTIP